MFGETLVSTGFSTGKIDLVSTLGTLEVSSLNLARIGLRPSLVCSKVKGVRAVLLLSN